MDESVDDPSFADQSTIVMDQSQDIASSPAKLDDDEENNRLMQEEERIRHQRETQSAGLGETGDAW